MRKSCGIITLCALALLVSAGSVTAQTAGSSTATADASITAVSVLGVVTDLKLDTRQVTVKTAAGNHVTVTLFHFDPWPQIRAADEH